MKKDEQTAISDSIERTLISPNESDRNGESANVVDGLFAISRGLFAIARALKESRESE